MLVVDVTKPPLKPRMSWYVRTTSVHSSRSLRLHCRYNPYDTTWAPSGWYKDGLVADMRYYYANA